MASTKVNDFIKNWGGGKQEPSVAEKIKGAFKPKEPLRYRLVMANYRLKTMISRLEVHVSRMQERDRVLFEKVVDAQMSKDNMRAAMYANEIAEIRKISKQLLTTQIALEQVQLRLETVTELGDVFTNLVPVIGVVNELRNSMRGVMPEISMELSELEEGLQEAVFEAGDFTGGGVDFTTASPEARKILNEAAVVAEQRMKENFPELPGFVTSTQKASNGTEQK
ncbi:cell division protein CdvB1/B2 [Sulfuracidifex tepidarius]|uniref:Cell division protein B2 n=1 Tax=Sulfuracidifex tepidarius TaxID=1294262 RepID=A0A510DUI4_9CREN|nr:cell division protein CdvB1/B2 [Sulfuracidifex tepidarius]BBG23824.1 Cell division protein B2 [Sulfuracidifex tepidarius]BBG26579.1 Cell division protein B2 [Sulfuracidifex tepidarius]